MIINIRIIPDNIQKSVDINPFLTVKEAKKKLQDLYGIAPDNCKWIFNAKRLDDYQTLYMNGITNHCTIYISKLMESKGVVVVLMLLMYQKIKQKS